LKFYVIEVKPHLLLEAWFSLSIFLNSTFPERKLHLLHEHNRRSGYRGWRTYHFSKSTETSSGRKESHEWLMRRSKLI
jgi:hypothetical protein